MFFLPNTLLFPPELEQSLRAGLWGKNDPQMEIPTLGKALRTLWPKLAKQRGISETNQHYSFQSSEARAYAAYYLPANALKPAVILEEAYLLDLELFHAENRWLDIGTGPGTFYWGLSWWAKHRHKKYSFIGLDQSPVFVKIAAQICNQSKNDTPARFEAIEPQRSGDWLSAIKKSNPTHVSFMNSVTEIYPQLDQRIEAIEKILRSLRELSRRDGLTRYLLLVEPGSRENSRDLSKLKDAMVEKKAASVLLPCTSPRICGALETQNDWCHEEVACEMPSWLNSLGMEAQLKKESLLFSYVLFSTQEKSALPMGLQRMVSQRLERKGQVECFFCTENGKQRLRVQNSKITADNQFFQSINRGSLFALLESGEKGDVEKALSFPAAPKKTLFYSNE